MRESFLLKPVYALAGWEGSVMVGEWAFDEGNRGFHYRHTVSDDPVVVVETAHGRDPRWLLGEFRHRRTGAPQHGYVAAMVPDRLIDAEVDGLPIIFEIWDAPQCWHGVGVIKDRAILIESYENLKEPLHFQLVADIDPFLRERHDWVRRARGE
ncbi:MAG: hypothetical protein ACRCSP_05465 [Rhodoglobus sp.]